MWDSYIWFLVCGSSEKCVIETLHRDVATSSGKQSQLHLVVSIRGSESTGVYQKSGPDTSDHSDEKLVRNLRNIEQKMFPHNHIIQYNSCNPVYCIYC